MATLDAPRFSGSKAAARARLERANAHKWAAFKALEKARKELPELATYEAAEREVLEALREVARF